MAKQNRGQRGAQGVPGPPGPVGHIGKTGATGLTGKTGATGSRGAQGKVGQAGPVSRSDRLNILSLVEGHIEEIHTELGIQMKRMAQLQAQVDDLRSKFRQLSGTAGEAGTLRRRATDSKA